MLFHPTKTNADLVIEGRRGKPQLVHEDDDLMNLGPDRTYESFDRSDLEDEDDEEWRNRRSMNMVLTPGMSGMLTAHK